MGLIKNKLSIILIILLLVGCISGIIYLEYPNFIGLSNLWESTKEDFWVVTITTLFISTCLTIPVLILSKKQAKEVSSLKTNDKITYRGWVGTFKSNNEKESGTPMCTIEIKVPLMSINKSK